MRAETPDVAPVPGTMSTSASILDPTATDTSAPGVSQKNMNLNGAEGTTAGVVALMDSLAQDTTTSASGNASPALTSPGSTALDTATSATTTSSTPTPATTSSQSSVLSVSATPTTSSTLLPTHIAQSPDTTVVPGRATRSGSSYFGVGGNIGIGSGDTALGTGSFAILSKIGLTRSFSVRPSLLISGDVTILLPFTYDFRFGEGPTSGFGFRAAPYVGIGPAITTGGGGSADLLLTGGLDIPISSQFTATAAVNATVTGNPAVGILLGVGYNFAGF